MLITLTLEIDCEAESREIATSALTKYFSKLMNLKSINDVEINKVSVVPNELPTMEHRVLCDLQNRHHMGDNQAAQVLLEHIRNRLN